jgi:hypothetical protein
MAIKGQKYKQYSDEIRIEAIRLHLEEGWKYRKITSILDFRTRTE